VLAVECRSDDPATAAQLRTLDHAPTRAAATTERGFLAGLGAGCTVPAGAPAGPAPGPGGEPAVRVLGITAAADGSAVIRGRVTGPAGDLLGRQLARMLLQHGGATLLDRARYQGQSPESRDVGSPSRW
jgi:hydroxymethylbilane synthase